MIPRNECYQEIISGPGKLSVPLYKSFLLYKNTHYFKALNNIL